MPKTGVDLTEEVKGVLPVANGGTGQAVGLGMLLPVQAHTDGSETYTIASGSVTQITGTHVQASGPYSPSVGDRILIVTAPAATGVGTQYVQTTQPANGIYVVTSNSTNLSVSRSADMSGSVNPGGLGVYSENSTLGWMAQTVFTVTTPASASAFTYGTGTIRFDATSGFGRLSGVGANGVYVPNGWGANWAAKLAAAKAGTGKAVLGVRGDSISYGYYSSNPITKSYPGLLASDLQTAYADGGSGFNGAYRTSRILTDAGVSSNTTTAWQTAGALWTVTGTWTTSALVVGPGSVALQSIVAASAATISFRGTILKIYTLTNGSASTATFTYNIDGAGAVTITDASTGGLNAVKVTTVSGLSAGTHSVVITKGSGTAPLYMIGIEGSNTTGVVVNNFGAPGATGSYEFPLVPNAGSSAASTVPGLWSGGSSNPCDLFIYAFGANECNRTLAANSTLTSAVSALASDFSISAPVDPGRYMIDSETFWIKRGVTGSASPFAATIYPDLFQTGHSSSAALKLPLARTVDWVRNLTQSFKDIRDNNPLAELVIVLPHIGSFDAWSQFNELASAARVIAEEYGAALINVWEVGHNSWSYWNGLSFWGDGSVTTPGIAGTDSIHPSDAGHQAYHDAIAPILKGQYLTSTSLSSGPSSGVLLASDASPTYAAGKLVFDSVNDCMTFFSADSGVSMQVGQEVWLRCRNVTGSTIPNGSPVYVVGSDSGLPSIALAKADAAATATVVGLTTESIATSTTGYVTVSGVVHTLNTSAFTAGVAVYVDPTTAGALTATPPTGVNYRCRVGFIVVSNSSTGSILVNPSDAITATASNGVYASRPTAGVAGRLYLCTDNGNTYQDNGSSWDLISVAGTGMPGVEPPSTSWTTSTLGSATLAADKGARLLTIPSAAGENWRYERRTLSPTSNYTVTGYIEATPLAPATDTYHAGLILGDGTKHYSFGPVSLASTVSVFVNGWNVGVRKWTNATTLSAEGANFTPAKLGCRPNWLRIRDDATTLFFEYSVNKIEWIPVFSEARTTFLTASVYGWGGNNSTGSSGLARLSSLSIA